MSGDVTGQKIDLACEEAGSYFHIRTDRHKIISVFILEVTSPMTAGGEEYATSIAVMGLDQINDHSKTRITRYITHGTELVVKSDNDVIHYKLGRITQIISGTGM